MSKRSDRGKNSEQPKVSGEPDLEESEAASSSSVDVGRRSFLSGTAASLAVGVTAGAGLLACSDDQSLDTDSAEAIDWDREVDVVVVGTGSGLVGGLAAASSGASVLALEKRKIVGGSTGHSGGVAWIPNNRFMREEGIEDSRENALLYMNRLAQRQADPELIEAFVDAGPEMADFVEANSSIRWRVSTIMGDNADYHPEWPGAVQKGRSIEPIAERPGLLGPELISGLQAGFEAAGGEILLETAAERLVTRDGHEGVREVLGVAAQKDGKPFFVRARKAVILAAGGFEWDPEMKRHFLRGPNVYSLGANGNTGDGIRMAMAAGSDLRNMNEVWGISVYKGEAEPLREHRMGATLNAEIEKRSAGSIIVNRRGERFQNEAADYDSTWRSYYTWENWGDLEFRNLPAFILFDSKVRQNGRIAGLDASNPLPDWVVEAPSLEELAEKLGIDPKGLARTASRFNAFAADLRDPDFTRGESSYDRYGSDDKSITLAPLDQPPFYGTEIAPADLGTCGGARVNAKAQVLDPFGRRIQGLYAAGNNAGVGSPGTSYGGGGGTIGPAMTFSFLAGRNAALDPGRT